MSSFMAPSSTPTKSKIHIPPSPFMKKIGYGTGVAVYELERSPVFNKTRSPWAVKKLLGKKSIRKEVDKRLQEEATILKQLKHKNIVGFRAFVKDTHGSNVLAMEECTSCLGNMIEDRSEDSLGPFPGKTIVKVCYDVSTALDYLHNEVLLMHCDIKSYNILVKGDFEICKLCDFGVTLPLNKDGTLNADKTGELDSFSGTEAWCAPELLQYPPEITSKADIYALGLVIWEMIALSPPVDEEFVNNMNNSMNSSELMYVRQRPALPDIQLDINYNYILEIYYCCTEKNLKIRPNAKELTLMFNEISAHF